MSSRFSTRIVEAIAGDSPWDGVLRGGKFLLFSGAVPATAETATTSDTYVMAITNNDAAWTAMARSTSTITLTAVTANDTFSITVGGVKIIDGFVCATGTEATEATALALAINTSQYNMGIRALASTNTVILSAPYGSGTYFDGAVVAAPVTVGTPTIGVAAFSGGGNGVATLQFERDATDPNKLIKPVSAVWKGTCPGTVTSPVSITYFRYVLDSGDNGYSDDTVNKAYRRWQGTVGGSTAGSADLSFPLVSTSVVDGVVLTISDFSFTIPLS